MKFLFFLLICFPVLATEITKIGIIDLGIDSNQVYSLKDFIDTKSSWNFIEDSPQNGIDYSYKNSNFFHGTYISHLITENENPKKLQIVDMTYSDGVNKKFNLHFFSFPSSLKEVYFKKKSYINFSSYVAKIFTYSINHNIKIINFSSADFGLDSPALYNALKELETKGIFVVVSAGNDSVDTAHSKKYPCSYNLKNIFCVGTVTEKFELSDYSNYGIDVDFYSVINSKNDYQGTSFSAPIITKKIYSIVSKNTKISFEEVRNILEKTAIKKNNLLIVN